MRSKRLRVAVLGDGGWGTTLAILLERKGFAVTLWSAFRDYAVYLDKFRENKKFFPGIKIPRGIVITADLRDALLGKELVVLAVPAQFLRGVLRKVKKIPYPRKAVYCSAAKGIEVGSLKRMSEIIREELGVKKIAALSGPTIAREVAFGIPTAAVIASDNKQLSKMLQEIFITGRFRIYTNNDLVGTELGGSLKNIIAIACGVCDGLGFGANTKAALLTRGLVEISRLGKAMGAKSTTFSGISGLGDLVTTCISRESRNRFVGEQLGKGKVLKQIQKNMQMVAEGVATAKSAYALSLKYKVETPIIREVYSLLYQNKDPKKAVQDLMTREKKQE